MLAKHRPKKTHTHTEKKDVDVWEFNSSTNHHSQSKRNVHFSYFIAKTTPITEKIKTIALANAKKRDELGRIKKEERAKTTTTTEKPATNWSDGIIDIGNYVKVYVVMAKRRTDSRYEMIQMNYTMFVTFGALVTLGRVLNSIAAIRRIVSVHSIRFCCRFLFIVCHLRHYILLIFKPNSVCFFFLCFSSRLRPETADTHPLRSLRCTLTSLVRSIWNWICAVFFFKIEINLVWFSRLLFAHDLFMHAILNWLFACCFIPYKGYSLRFCDSFFSVAFFDAPLRLAILDNFATQILAFAVSIMEMMIFLCFLIGFSFILSLSSTFNLKTLSITFRSIAIWQLFIGQEVKKERNLHFILIFRLWFCATMPLWPLNSCALRIQWKCKWANKTTEKKQRNIQRDQVNSILI